VGYVRLLAGKEVVQTNDVVALLNQPFAQMGAEETGAAGHEDPFQRLG